MPYTLVFPCRVVIGLEIAFSSFEAGEVQVLRSSANCVDHLEPIFGKLDDRHIAILHPLTNVVCK
jgi:hypothetical protein